MGDVTTLQFQIGLGKFRLIERRPASGYSISATILNNIVSIIVLKVITIIILVNIIAITTAIQAANYKHRLISRHLYAIYCFGYLLCAGGSFNNGIPAVAGVIRG